MDDLHHFPGIIVKYWLRAFIHLYLFHNKITGKSSESLTTIFFIASMILLLAVEAQRFEFDAYFSNTITVLLLVLYFFAQNTFHNDVAKVAKNKKDGFVHIEVIINWTRYLHEWAVIGSIFWIALFFTLTPLSFLSATVRTIWHVGSLYYIDIGGTSAWSKLKSKVKTALESRTPILAPVPA